MNATKAYREALASIPRDVSLQVRWSFSISDKIDARLKELGMTQKDLSRKMGKTEPEVSRWLSGTHNFTLTTLAKISAAIDQDLLPL